MHTRSGSHPSSTPRHSRPSSADARVMARAEVAVDAPPPGAIASGRAGVTGKQLFSQLVSGLVSAGIGAMRNFEAAMGCFARGLLGFLRGRFSTGGRELGRGLLKLLVQLPLDLLLSLGGRLVSGIQTLLGAEPVGGRLGTRQLAELRKVFGDSIDYEQVRLKVGRLGLLGLPNRPFVLGNTLYVPRDIPSTASGAIQLPMHLVLQIMGHVWQYQNGGTDYVCETLWGRWFEKDSDWRTALDEGRGWSGMDPGQQVRFLKEAYARSAFFAGPGQRFIDEETGVDYTEWLEDALELLWTRQGAP